MSDSCNRFVPTCTTYVPIEHHDADGRLAAAARTATIWDRPPRGPVQLNVVFLDGDPTVQALVKRAAKTWEQFAHIRFNFLGPERYADAHIRITMPPSRSFWSYLGNQSVAVDRRLPSMTLGFTPDVLADPREIRRLVLHEFGHALGLIHEHQNPKGGLVFRIPQVYDYFCQTQGWDERTVREQVLIPANAAELKNGTQFDPDSIMLYSFPASIIAGGPVTATKTNYELSDLDRSYIASIYPKPDAPAVADPTDRATGFLPLTIGEPTRGLIPIRGAEIPYGFEITEAATYAMETATPPGAREEFWVLTLCTPDHAVLATDDKGSSPHGLNALIDRPLDPGRYLLKVRHRLRDGLGAFTVSIRKSG